MADRFKEKRERNGISAVSQHEADAQLIREKMARLRALRLAQEAANNAAGAASPPATAKSAAKKKARKSGEKTASLSDWLATQQNQGRRG